MTLKGKPIDAGKKYKVAGWAPVAEGASGQPIWELMATYLRDKKSIKAKQLNLPHLVGMKGNAGLA
jgi:sulfur-oxidizing protein SoxB